MLEATIRCHKGLVRKNNEDTVLENESLGLWVVADGVGGNAFGEVASQLATQTIERKVRQGAGLRDAIIDGDLAIRAAAENDDRYASMATTVVACHFNAGHYELAWVGDSRAYIIDQSGICQISADHNVANALYQSGEIDAVEREVHPGQHELTQALGQLQLDEVPRTVGELHDGDYLLLCTDGLSGVISEQDIASMVLGQGDVESASDLLLDKTLSAGAPDNVSFALIRYQRDDPGIHAADFGRKCYRAPFTRRTYEINARNRPLLLLIIMISILVLMFAI